VQTSTLNWQSTDAVADLLQRKSYEVVACGSTLWLPLGGTVPIPLMLASGRQGEVATT